MRARRRIGAAVVAAVVAAVGWTLPARSQDDQAVFRQEIEAWLALANARTGGPVAVRADAVGAVATLPDIIVAMPDATMRLGTMTILRRPAADGRTRYEATFAREMRVESGTEITTVTLGDGGVALEVDPRTGLSHLTMARLTDVQVQTVGDPARVAIGTIEVASSVTGRADGLSDSPFRIALQNVQVDGPQPGLGLTVGELVFGAALQGFRLADYQPLYVATSAALASGDMGELARAVEQWLAFPFASLPVEISLADVVYRDGGADPAVAIGRASLRQSVGSLSGQQTAFSVRYAHNGFALRADMTPYPQFVPGTVQLDVAIDGLPAAEMRDILVDGVSTGSIAADSFWQDAFFSLLVAAIDNGATLRLAPLEIGAELVGVTANAQVTGNDRAPYSAVGTAELVIRGLEEAARALVGGGPGSGPDSPAGVVAIITALGQAGTDSSGRPTRSYRIEVDEQGRVLLNGSDMTAFIGGGANPAPPQPAPPTPPAPGK